MKQPYKTTISCRGIAQVQQRPSYVVLLGKIHTSAPTLELAIQKLDKKQAAFIRWLRELSAEELKFGEPRLPEHTPPDSVQLARQMYRKTLCSDSDPSQESYQQKRTAVVNFSARWPIEGMSSRELLIFLDRIEYEAAELQEAKDERKPRLPWEVDPVNCVQSAAAQLLEPAEERDEISFLYLASLSEAQREKALSEAICDARSKAAMLARSTGDELGDLHISYLSTSKDDAGIFLEEVYRNNRLPVLRETPFQVEPHELVQETPRIAQFNFSVHMRFGLK